MIQTYYRRVDYECFNRKKGEGEKAKGKEQTRAKRNLFRYGFLQLGTLESRV